MKWGMALLVALTVGCASVPRYEVVRVIDGDTFIVVGPDGKRDRVQLRRVNAPELSDPGGEEARAALAEKYEGRRIRLKSYARDCYGRLVAEIE